MAILCRLARDYNPHREGYQEAGRFSGYASVYLPRKLGDAWHGLHPEHLRTTEPGGRRWQYVRRPPASLDAISTRIADPAEDAARDLVDLKVDLASVLKDSPDVDLVLRVAALVIDGRSVSEITWLLRLRVCDVRACEARLRGVAAELGLGPAPQQVALFP